MNIQSPLGHQIVVIGGGFAGIQVVRGLRRCKIDVKLIDRRNFHLFQPLLYQIASGVLSPANIASPLRQIFSRQKNVQVLMGDVVGIDCTRKRVQLPSAEIPYDTLIVAAGATHSYFGNDKWEANAPGLKTIEDAVKIRSRVLEAFEVAELESDPAIRNRLLTFVIVGAGPTGVELAGALAEISRKSLRDDFRTINPAEAKILLVEGSPHVLGTFPEELSRKSRASLEHLGVTVMTGSVVTDIGEFYATVKTGDHVETIPTSNVLWAAGVKASPLGKMLHDQTGAELDRTGRVIVNKDLSLPNHPEIFVIGDIANYQHGTERPLPGVAPVAIQQGTFVAKLLKAKLERRSLPEFKYKNLGNLATIGRWSAVADFGWLRISGFVAWFLWLVIHLMNIVTFRNRLLVAIQWGWCYITNDRSARLITNETLQQLDEEALSHPPHPEITNAGPPK